MPIRNSQTGWLERTKPQAMAAVDAVKGDDAFGGATAKELAIEALNELHRRALNESGSSVDDALCAGDVLSLIHI